MQVSHDSLTSYVIVDSGLGIVSIVAISIIALFVLVVVALIVVAKVTKRWCFAGKKDTIV